MIEGMCSMCEALDLIPSTAREKKKEREKEREF
jgi:hypothetical protein